MSDLVKGDLHRVLHYINCLKHNLRHAVEFTFFCLSDFSFTGSSLKSQIFIRLSSPHICTKKNNMEEKNTPNRREENLLARQPVTWMSNHLAG